MKAPLVTVLAMLWAGMTAQAQLFVYQGRATLKTAGNTNATSLPLKLFTVIGPASNYVASITYNTATATQPAHYSVSRGSVVLARVIGKKAKAATVFISAGRSGNRYSQVRYSGNDAVLKTATLGTNSFPRTFTGLHNGLSTDAPATTSDLVVSLTYSGPRTIAANDAAKTPEQVLTDLQAELEALGITPFPTSETPAPGTEAGAPLP